MNKNTPIYSRSAGRRQWALYLVLAAAGAGSLWFVQKSTAAAPDFTEFVAGEDRKAAFFQYMRPLIVAENERILHDRARLLAIAQNGNPGWLDRLWVSELAERYGLDDPDPEDDELLDRLRRRVDAVPLPLVLAQAAKESGWGTSRFAREGNNMFGEWCFENGCGIVPKARSAGRSHEVESFFSPRSSVASYLRNINSHPKYREFRLERARQRDENRQMSAVQLAEKLTHYSERRDAYVEELKQIIVTNNLDAPPDDASN